MNGKEIKAYQCEKCGDIHLKQEQADNCCTCTLCDKYICRWDGKGNYIHCTAGYTCDSFSSRGSQGTYSKFEKMD